MDNKVIILMGKSGSGKDRIARELVSSNLNISYCISTTTRPIRDGEVDGVDYHYIQHYEKFKELLDNDKFVEHREYNTDKGTWYYGLEKMEFEHRIRKGNVVLILDPQGTKEFLSHYKHKHKVHIYYIYANDKIRKERSVSRGSHDEAEWNRRFESDNKMFSAYNITNLYEYELYNNGEEQLDKNVRFILNRVKGLN